MSLGAFELVMSTCFAVGDDQECVLVTDAGRDLDAPLRLVALLGTPW
jgi:hypothetical protein